MSRHKISFIALVLLVGLVGCVLPSVFPFPPSIDPTPILSPTPDIPPRLNLAYGNLPDSIDPHRTSDIFAAQVLRFVCQGLTDLGDEPLLAESWEYASDKRSIVFRLRQDVVFRDGTPFNAEAVQYSFLRLQQPEAKEAGSPLYDEFQGVQIETPDEYTVIFKFDEPRSDFLDLLNSGYAAIISPSATESEIARNPVCTGPYYVKSWVPGEFILLTKNDNHTSVPDYYENQGAPYIDEVKLHLIETHDERIQELLAGNLDANHINTKKELADIKERADDFEIRRGHWLGGITYLGFNYARTPTNELMVRQALAHAVDKGALIDAVLADEFAIPAVSLLSPLAQGYSDELDDVEYKFDLELSRQLLAEAGFEDLDGDGVLERDGEILRLQLLTTTDNIYLHMATDIQNLFAEIGVVVEIKQEPRTIISEITPTGEFDLLLYDYNWPYPSALNLFLHSGRVGNTNRVAYSNPEADKLLDEIAVLEEDETTADIYEEKIIEAQRIIIKDVPWQPILARRAVSAVSTRVEGEKMHESGALLWHDARILEGK